MTHEPSAAGHAETNTLLAAGSGGFSGAHSGDGEGTAGAAGASAKPVVDRAGAGGTAPNTPSTGNAGAVATAMQGSEVWIGELWTVAPSVCDPTAPLGAGPIVIEATGYLERVVLILEYDELGQLGGRIQFGQGVLPDDPGDAPYADSGGGTFWLCSVQGPAKGAEYSLLGAARTSSRLMFEIAPTDIWASWCETQHKASRYTCACQDMMCHANRDHRVFFDLSASGSQLEGDSPVSSGFGTVGNLRLRRVQ